MKTEFLLIAAFTVCVSLFAMIETVWTVIKRPTEAFRRFERASTSFGMSRAYLIIALFGYICVVYCGIYGMLFWVPSDLGSLSEDGEFISLRFTVSGLITLAALPVVGLLADYSRMLNEIPEWKQTLKGAEQMIGRVHNLPPVIESFRLGHDAAPDGMREANFWWLHAHAEMLHRNVSNMIENALTREGKPTNVKPVEVNANAVAKAVEAQAQSERKQVQIAQIEAALDAALPHPVLQVVNTLPGVGMTEWVRIDTATVNACWTKLHKIFSALAVSDGRRETDEVRLTDISAALLTAPGIDLPVGLKVVGHYRGDAHFGKTEIVATLNEKKVELVNVTRFAMTLDGLCTAFFIVHLAPKYGNFWHGFYGRDYSILFDRLGLAEWLLHSGIDVANGGDLHNLKCEPGLRVSLAGTVLRASALGAGLTTDLTDFSIKLVNGKIVDSARQVLASSKTVTLY